MEESIQFKAKMQEGAFHQQTLRDDDHFYYWCFWPINNFSIFKAGITEGFKFNDRSFKLYVGIKQEELTVAIQNIRFGYSIAISTDSGHLITKVHEKPLIVKDEDFQSLKELPNDTVIITCQIRFYMCNTKMTFNCIDVSNFINVAKYSKFLQIDLKQHSRSSLKEKIQVHVGEETEIVNKAVLCARSPVFARMFSDDMREKMENAVTITDIKMPVVRALVFFLNSGTVPNCDLDFLCDLYYSACKYQIEQLHLACIGLILSKVSRNNIMRVFKLSLLHNDQLLKSAVLTLISAKIETIVSTPDWQDLMCNEPDIALRAATFFDF